MTDAADERGRIGAIFGDRDRRMTHPDPDAALRWWADGERTVAGPSTG